MSLLADYNLPFAAALALMVVLGAIQAVGIGDLFGDADVDLDVDGDVDVDGHGIGAANGAIGGLLSLLGIGRVPLMIWLASFLFVFAALGVSIQGLAGNLTGAPLDRLLAALIAAGAALPLTGLAVRPLARILPGDETSAVSLDTLVGRRAIIATGRARAGYPARARVEDRFGHSHHVMVEPHEHGAEFTEGESVLLVRREDQTFFAVALQERRLESLS